MSDQAHAPPQSNWIRDPEHAAKLLTALYRGDLPPGLPDRPASELLRQVRKYLDGWIEVPAYRRRRPGFTRPKRKTTTKQVGLFESLEEAREKVRAGLDVGTRCPCCDQFAKRYRRKITSSMAWALVLVDRYFQENPSEDWLHIEDHFKALPDLPSKVRGDAAKLVVWELIDKWRGKRPDGSGRTGFYRITQRGRAFVAGELAVHQVAVIYNGICEGFEGERVTLRDCWAEPFSYRELMTS